MKILLCLAVLVAVVYAEIPGMKKACPDKKQPAGDTGCLYYCDDSDTNYGIYNDGSPCDYTGSLDGKCKGGLCYAGPNSKLPDQES
uniref:BTSP n=1 Tax=Ornithodoros coriaceus TaxID=92741 RepID=B2D281_ORNCO|nr:BTSP [Ornithodoros coriaceus]